jgi:Flp pilus assembly pilin Flp
MQFSKGQAIKTYWEVRPVEAIRRFVQDESGITAAEYGIILGAITGVLVLGIVYFYTNLGNLFSKWGGWFSTRSTP